MSLETDAVNIKAAAKFLGVSRSTIYRLINDGLLPYRRVNPNKPKSTRLIPISALRKFTQDHTHTSTE